jgi:hypothetical protein
MNENISVNKIKIIYKNKKFMKFSIFNIFKKAFWNHFSTTE